jgi:hypothetical protein
LTVNSEMLSATVPALIGSFAVLFVNFLNGVGMMMVAIIISLYLRVVH